MAQKRPKGICRLCGGYQTFSFEHIPPKKAFNNQQQLFQTMQNLQDEVPYSRFRRGVGKHSLCERCNNLTGSWYGSAFVEWTKQGMELLDRVRVDLAIDLPFFIYPLRVIKQIFVMAIAMIGEGNVAYHSKLRSFLLNERSRYLPVGYRIHTYFTNEGSPRFASGMAIMKADSGHGSYIVAEVSLPPLGYVITEPVGNFQSLADFEGLYDITWFANYYFDEWRPVFLRLPKRETHKPVPLIYDSEK